MILKNIKNLCLYFISYRLLFFILFLFILSIPITARADINIFDDHSCPSPYGSFTRDYVFVDYVFPSGEDLVSGMKVLVQGATAPYGSYINICDKDFTDPYISNHDCAGGTLVASANCVVDTLLYGGVGTVLLDCPLDHEYAVDTGRYILETVNMAPEYCSYGGTPSGILGVNSDGGSVYGQAGYRIGYQLYSGYETIPTYEYIYPEAPLDGSTAFSNNNVVGFFGTYTNDATDKLYIDIYDLQFNHIWQSNKTFIIGHYPTPEPYNFNIPLPAGDYAYKLYLTNIGTSTVATTTDYIYFTFDSFKIGTSITPFKLTEAQICDGVATSTIMGGIECAFKKVIFWAITPSADSVAYFQKNYIGLKASFPFSAFFELTDAVNDGIGTSTPNMAGTLDMPFINNSGDYIMLPVISSTSLPNLIGATNATLFRNSLKWILWALVAFIIFITFKKL